MTPSTLGLALAVVALSACQPPLEQPHSPATATRDAVDQPRRPEPEELSAPLPKPEPGAPQQARAVNSVISHPPPMVPLRHDTIDVTGWRFGPVEPSPVEALRQVALRESAVPWAQFLATVHNQLHPVFADEYLRSLDALPPGDTLNDKALQVDVGLALERTGEIASIYVRHSSGSAEFDVAALSAFFRVFPIPVPQEILSTDGHAYLEWTLHRGLEACAAINAHPYRLARR